MLQPHGRWFNTILVTACNDTWERSRLEWRLTDGGNPAVIAESFLAAHGVGLPILAQSQRANADSYHYAAATCGATIFVSAAGAAAMRGLFGFPPSPAPSIPDLVVVVYGHGSPPELSLRNSPTLAEANQPGRSPTLAEANQAGRSAWSAVRLDRAAGRPATDHPWWVGEWTPSWTPRQHRCAVASVRDAIARGDVYQVNVVGHASAPYRGDPNAALRRVRGLPGAAYGQVLAGTGWAIASASPEMLVRVIRGPDRGHTIETRPIKGTRPATAAGRYELLASAKERAEHVMIVDLERNDLAQIAAVGSVDVPELFAVRRWCDLWQAQSRVVARLADGVGLADLLVAVLPGGSVTGAPKLAALAEIAGLEPVGRGPAMGALGWIDHRGLDLGLTIRTVAAADGRVHLWAGGGITWDSDPSDEVAEAEAKAAPIRAALAGPEWSPARPSQPVTG